MSYAGLDESSAVVKAVTGGEDDVVITVVGTDEVEVVTCVVSFSVWHTHSEFDSDWSVLGFRIICVWIYLYNGVFAGLISRLNVISVLRCWVGISAPRRPCAEFCSCVVFRVSFAFGRS